MEEKLICVNDLEVVYKTDCEVVRAVNGISFDIKRGATLGLVGETGAGKTTTALTLLRLLPDRTGHILNGEIIFNKTDLLTVSEQELRSIRGDKIAMIFQDPMTSLNPVITVGDQIAEALELHKKDGDTNSTINQRVEEVLELVGIPASRKNDYPHQFSGGMRQRVVIAMALACEPELLIADEPTTALDVTIQAQVIAMMKDLQNRLQTAMLFITHDLGVIAEICDYVAVMYAGKIVEYGTLEDIFSSYQHHPYTVGLFESTPNLKVKSKRLTPITGLMPDPTDLPEGCFFAPRCKHCSEICLKKQPKVYCDGTHKILCHLYSNG